MKKKKVYGVFDTETVGLSKKYIYDIGIVITRKGEEPFYVNDWAVGEMIHNPLIKEAKFFVPRDYEKRRIISWKQIREEFNYQLHKYSVDVLVAYNMAFDVEAIRQTTKVLLNRETFLTKKVEYFDLWLASCLSFMQQKQYKDWAPKSKAGNTRTNAETAFRFLERYGDNGEYIHQHTALDDAITEEKILQHVLRQKKRIIRNEFVAHPWRMVQERAG